MIASVHVAAARHLRDWTPLLVSTASQHVAAARTLVQRQNATHVASNIAIPALAGAVDVERQGLNEATTTAS